VTILRMVPGFLPELTGDFDRIDAGPLPPGLFVTGTVMRAAQRNGEFVARFAAERPRL
jgi:hypothetical protein